MSQADSRTKTALERRPAVPLGGGRAPTSLVRVLLCEDQEVFRLGLQVVLEAEPDIAVVGETNSLSEALDEADRMGAEVVVVRRELVAEASLPLLRDLCRYGPPVLVLADPEPEAEVVEVLRAGVRGYLPRRACAQRLVEGVRALARQEVALDPVATDELVRHVTAPESRRPLDVLTERQRDVAELVAQGLSNEEIARRLFLSLATVKSHVTAVMRRLEVHTRTQLAILVNRGPWPAA